MDARRMSLAGLAALVVAAPAFAAEAPDEVVATAQGRPDAPMALSDPMAVMAAIPNDGDADRMAPGGPAGAGCRDGAAAADPSGERKVHGSVSVGVGTNDYRSASGVVSVPIGKCGSVTVGYGQSRMKGPGYYGFDPYAYGGGYYGGGRPFP